MTAPSGDDAPFAAGLSANVRPGESLALRIAGVTVDVTSHDVTMKPHGGAEPFRVAPSAHADVRLVARFGDLDDGRWKTPVAGEPTTRLFDSGGVWNLEADDDALTFRFHSPRFGDAPYKIARFDHALDHGEVILNAAYFGSDEPVDVLEYPLDEVLFVHRLWRASAVEVHGCAVRDEDGSGILFIGHSGAGKSTMARLWAANPKVAILSDDRVVVRRIGDELFLFGTPWHGDGCFARAESVKLTNVFFPRHAKQNGARRLEATEAAAQIFARVFLPFYDARAITETLALLDTLASTVPVHEVDVVPDARIVDFLRTLVPRGAH